MSEIAIRVEGLSKQYSIGGPRARYKTIRESIMDGARAPFRRAGRLLRGQAYGAAELDQTIWALKDVSFEVKQGEVVGIIGRNGAGKSTLLKILSRITEPTEGEVMLRGRVGSLLEVGTGFHPELTGRENVYLNGAILGMKRPQIDRSFDQIVDFAEVEKFIDTPVKHYSSGMYVRLAFSVAAHMDPEILIVDEVLSVGDLSFQQKCLATMESSAGEGKTVLLVSHNLASVRRICKEAILLDEGKIAESGPADQVINDYFEQSARHFDSELTEVEFPSESDLPMQILRVRLTDDRDRILKANHSITGGLRVQIEYCTRRPIQSAYVMCAFTNQEGMDVVWTYDGDSEEFSNRKAGMFRSEFALGSDVLRSGRYLLRCAIVDANRGAIHYPGPALSFTVEDTSTLLAHRNIQWPGVVRLNPDWKTTPIEGSAVSHVPGQ